MKPAARATILAQRSRFVKPYLDELHLHLGNQYLLTFAGDGGAKGNS